MEMGVEIGIEMGLEMEMAMGMEVGMGNLYGNSCVNVRNESGLNMSDEMMQREARERECLDMSRSHV